MKRLCLAFDRLWWRSPGRPQRPTCRGPRRSPTTRRLRSLCRRPIAGPGSISASTAAAVSAARPGIAPAAAMSAAAWSVRRSATITRSAKPSLGVEGDIDWADIDGSTTNACPAGCKTSDTWLSTVRGRLGYAADRFMPFVTGGAAFGDIRASTPGFPQAAPTIPAGRSAAALKPRSPAIGRPRSSISMSISAASIAGSIAAPGLRPTTSRSTPTFCAPA